MNANWLIGRKASNEGAGVRGQTIVAVFVAGIELKCVLLGERGELRVFCVQELTIVDPGPQ